MVQKTGLDYNAHRRVGFLVSSALAGTLLLATAPALAQTEASANAAAAVDSTEIILVTAQKRSEALEDVPISIAAVSAEKLQSSGIQMVRDLPMAIPALRVNYAGTFVLPTIRGVGSIVSLPGLVQNIATYVDGFYIPTASASNFELVNVESVNVLKGPQGTLFGANATGGAIMINTKKPQQEFSGLVRAGYGSYNNVKTAAYVTGGLTEGIAASIAGSYERGDGYVTNVFDGNDKVAKFKKWAIRPQLLIEPTDDLSILLAYEHTYTNDPGTQMVVARNGVSVGSPIFPHNAGSQLVFDSPKRISQDYPGQAIRETDAFTAKIQYDAGFADITSYTGYRTDEIFQALDYDASTVNAGATSRRWTVPDSTFTQELNITSNGDSRFNWVLGAFYLHFEDDYSFNVSLDNVNFFEAFASHNYANSYAAFAEGTYEVIDDLYLTVGGRYTHDKPCVTYINPAVLGTGCVTFKDFATRAVARYELTPSSNIYFSFSQGYRSGGMPASAFTADPANAVKPEHIDAYEVGFKTASRGLRLNVAAFFYDYTDIQVTSYLDGGLSRTINAGRSHIYGLDADLSYRVTDDLTVTLAGTLTDARYTDFGRYEADGTCTNCAGFFEFVTNPLDPRYGTIDASNPIPVTGFDVERTPTFAGSASVDYGFDLAEGRMVLNANLFYTQKYFFDAAHQLFNPSHTLVNLRATWTDPSDHFDVSVYAKNVLNEKYFRSNFNDPLASRAVYAEPVTFGGSVSYRW